MRTSWGAMLVAAVACAGCGGDGTDKATNEAPPKDAGSTDVNLDAIAVAKPADLPACDAQHAGQLAYVQSEGKLYACLAGEWKAANLSIETTKGDTGEPGRKGDMGEPGSKGADGAAGKNALVKSQVEAPGANCPSGGVRLDVGVDDDGDGSLATSEVDTTAYVCNGLDSLVLTTPEPAGPNCAFGGQRVDVGVDDNTNSVLDAAEIDQTRYICNGADGLNALASISSEPAGGNCATGGQALLSGLDANRNGMLEPSEMSTTRFVCNGTSGASGSNGYSSLVATSAEPAGANCATGGQKIQTGLDDGMPSGTANDGVLQPGEVQSTSYLCLGADQYCTITDNGNGTTTLACPGGHSLVFQTCGNGRIDGTEQCDDGNTSNNDFCSAACKVCNDPLTTALTKTGAALADTGAFPAAALGAQASIEWWVRFTQTSSNDNAEMAVSTAYDDSNTGGWFCRATTNQIAFALRYADPASQLVANTTISINQWHHVACDYDGATMRLFLDGALVGSKSASGQTDAYSGHLLLLFRNQFSSGNTATFGVREIRVGNQSVHPAAFSPTWSVAPVSGTVALFHAADGSGAKLSNAVQGAPAANLSGATTWTTYGSVCQ